MCIICFNLKGKKSSVWHCRSKRKCRHANRILLLLLKLCCWKQKCRVFFFSCMEHSVIECRYLCVCMFVLVFTEIRSEAISSPNRKFDSDRKLLETNSLCTTVSHTGVSFSTLSSVLTSLRCDEYMITYRRHISPQSSRLQRILKLRKCV
jgi:hypothetical protein